MIDRNQLRANNSPGRNVWEDIYEALNRVNIILETVPPLTDLEETEKNQILGEAYALRALNLHNLTKFWGDVAMPLVSPKSVEEASQITRTPAAEVYAQIGPISSRPRPSSPRLARPPGSPRASWTRCKPGWRSTRRTTARLWRTPMKSLRRVTPSRDDFASLFDAEGTDTPEDILKIIFTAEQFMWLGYYYTSSDLGGDGSVGPSQRLIDLFDPADLRGIWSISGDTEGEASGLKFPTTIGAEDFHVIRLAEVLLIKAEALARQNDLVGAVDAYNPLRERAGLPPYPGRGRHHPGRRAGRH